MTPAHFRGPNLIDRLRSKIIKKKTCASNIWHFSTHREISYNIIILLYYDQPTIATTLYSLQRSVQRDGAAAAV